VQLDYKARRWRWLMMSGDGVPVPLSGGMQCR
jgi:hypothetical protein